MSNAALETKKARSRVYEVALGNYLRSHGYWVLPAYDYNGKEGDKAPRLMGKSRMLVTPDLLAFSGQKSAWFEVKLKARADMYRKTCVRVTGLPLRHWRDYCDVKSETGLPVWLIFIHEAENAVVVGELSAMPLSHTYAGSAMDRGGTIFFAYDRLKRLMATSDLKKWSA